MSTTVIETAPPKAAHKDSMKSTWRKHPETWNASHHILTFLDGFSSYDDRPIPKHEKTDKVPYLSEIQTNRWILFHAFVAMGIHQAYIWLTGRELSYYGAFLIYSTAYQVNAILLVRLLRRLGHLYGFYDGDSHTRDGVPDNNVTKTFTSLASTTLFRPIMMVALTYKPSEGPLSISLPWLFVEIGAYSVILDFYFYWYHRCMHEFDSLWKYHRTHHLTKHPIALLSAFADEEQEVMDILGIPLLTYVTMKLMGFPLGFYEWWICYEYVIFSEAFGHSGVRMCGTPPSSVSPLLWATGCELIGEDHDLHHRFGYKTSGNYGKQTRLWDRIFGTCKDRIESPLSNLDYENRVVLPLFTWQWPALPPRIEKGEEPRT